MTREDYEERLRALGAQLEADIAMVRAGHEARVRALESLWQAAQAGDAKAAVPAPAPAPPAAPRETARPPGTTCNDLRDALPRLPQVFDKRDVVRALGYKPPYTTLVRALARSPRTGDSHTAGASGRQHPAGAMGFLFHPCQW